MENFDLVKSFIEKVVDRPTFEKWISPLSFIAAVNNIILVGSTDPKKLLWVRQNLLEKINKLTKKELGITLKLVSLSEEE
ncbi:MAG: hypothetical protein L0Y73_03970, partial [Candidatus Aminicenantes bacterium]|nr:hypothetical protein [Candidatus Aminicenantes bacterium]